MRVDVERSRPRARVTLTLGGALVGQSILSPSRTQYRFAVVNGPASAKGSLSAAFAGAADLSSLSGSFVVGSPRGPSRFTGTLETWLPANSPAGSSAPARALAATRPHTAPHTATAGRMSAGLPSTAVGADPLPEQDYDLTPELQTRTHVVGDAKNGAQVDVYDGTVLIASVSMTQTSPVAVIAHEVVLGSARIASGATFTLTIPTPLQLGQVVLQASFQSQGGPLTPFASAIATWPW